ncbi:multisubunit sodium/proton antiporter MrpG subunit [Pontibacter ummariensis]|uniref:Multisubunit sodium/proton antiporter, MrpG subunit n=1 Tax=Pontibacter ummariensis TaxID=1610492 RepID=A0A239BWL8_9BACT|nr:monovalent cation/H(+) antiporter subunit G [Pontibacter ummariensis]PRY15589.1 multisubunit sodium/proton antiporter MrpG subunit [Pontibacter ummariensis]SNS12042.1 multisubunit sodium/proton antiporter, MrpG subunit [Pontibacter ummariensis]
MLENIDFVLLRELISCVLILAGVLFMLIANIGLLRFPDFYIRMSAITKGATLGLGLILLGIGVYFNQSDILLKVFLVIGFSFVTAPVAAHVIGRTAVQNKIPFWQKTNLKEFKDYLAKEHLEQVQSQDKYREQALKKKSDDAGT